MIVFFDALFDEIGGPKFKLFERRQIMACFFEPVGQSS